MRRIVRWLGSALVYGSLAGGGALMLAAPACGGPAADFCNAYCDCVLCNDRQEDECQIEAQRLVDISDAIDCREDFDVALDCVVEDANCEDRSFRVDPRCADDLTRLGNCAGDNSDLYGLGGLFSIPESDPPQG